MHEPVIFINSQKLRELDISIDLQKIYYHPSGYQRTSKKLYDVSYKAGFDFTLIEVQEWLEKQLLHLIHKPRPRYIPCASFNKITVPMKVIQADLCYMPHDKIGNKIYKYALTSSRTKWVCPLTERDSASVAKGFIKLFKFYNFPLTRMATLQTDYGPEFYGKCEELRIKYNWAFFIQDAVELLLPPIERCRAWVTDLTIFLEKLDNTVTRLIDMPPAEARKLKHVYAMSYKPRYGPMGYDEVRLTYSDSVLYLLNPGELEGGRRRVTDMNWSPQIYHIKESLIQKNQPEWPKTFFCPRRIDDS
ncbi:hypothetical protein Glove_328g69 [Diversispora epigaea]|uniref:Integrase catalytic domain-containing protein n=1 Tax=Diversispora epigaea TaxID=1348612 RepID=A0A397HKQ8_9GLOM|nr:hypothetical protein Glove_328g69 [Diversispora epigaea]